MSNQMLEKPDRDQKEARPQAVEEQKRKFDLEFEKHNQMVRRKLDDVGNRLWGKFFFLAKNYIIIKDTHGLIVESLNEKTIRKSHSISDEVTIHTKTKRIKCSLVKPAHQNKWAFEIKHHGGTIITLNTSEEELKKSLISASLAGPYTHETQYSYTISDGYKK